HVIAGVLRRQKEQAESVGADEIVALDDDHELGELPPLDAIADTVGHDVTGRVIPKLKPGGVLGSVLGKPKLAEGKEIRIEAVVAQPDPALLRRLAEAIRDKAFDIPIAKRFKLSEAGEAQALSE